MWLARAAEALSDIGNKIAVEGLIFCLEDYDEDVRQIAVYAIGEIGKKIAVEPILDKSEW
jgi:HEAT repeat protein